MSKNEFKAWSFLVAYLLTILCFITFNSCTPGTYIFGYELVPSDSLTNLEGLYVIYGEDDSTKHIFKQLDEGLAYCYLHMEYENIERRDGN